MAVFQTFDPHTLVDRKKALAAKIAGQVQSGGAYGAPAGGGGGGGAPSFGTAFHASTGSARGGPGVDLRGTGNIASSIFGKLGAGYGESPASQLAGQLANGVSMAGMSSAGSGAPQDGSSEIVPLGNGQYYDPFLGQVAGNAAGPTQGQAAQTATQPALAAAPAAPAAPAVPAGLDPAIAAAMQAQQAQPAPQPQQVVGLPTGAPSQAWINFHYGREGM